MTDDERDIRELVEMWMDASRRGDLPAVLDLMCDNVMFLTPGSEPFGKEAFRAAFESMRGLDLDGRSVIEEMQILGDWAWIRNHIEMTVTSASGEPIRRSGYALTILQRGSDGRWRLFRDANLVS